MYTRTKMCHKMKVIVSHLQQHFGIKTAGLEEKATACQMLVCYARELKEGFASYTEEVVNIMVPMLKFYFHDGILFTGRHCKIASMCGGQSDDVKATFYSMHFKRSLKYVCGWVCVCMMYNFVGIQRDQISLTVPTCQIVSDHTD